MSTAADERPKSPWNRHRTIISIAVLIGLFLLVWAGVAAAISRYLSYHVYTYEVADPPVLNGSPVFARITPGKRIQNSYPDRAVGPPYWVMLAIKDPTRTASAAVLHSLRIVNQEGVRLDGEVTVRHKVREPHLDEILLYSTFSEGEWGPRPSMIADLEILLPSGNVRQEITFPLRPQHTSTLNIVD